MCTYLECDIYRCEVCVHMWVDMEYCDVEMCVHTVELLLTGLSIEG